MKWEYPKIIETPTKGLNTQRKKIPSVRDWQKVLILGQHPHIITLVKGLMASHSQVRWLFLCSVFGAMINKPTHGSGDRHRSFPGGIFISLPPPSIFVFHRPAGPKLEREKDQGWQLWVQWISTSLIHGRSHLHRSKRWKLTHLESFEPFKGGWGLLLFELEKTWIAFFPIFWVSTDFVNFRTAMHVIERSLIHG